MMKVVCHVDDLKVSHKDPLEVAKFYQYPLTKYRGKLKVYRGNIHDYLVIYLYHSETGVVKLLVMKFLKRCYTSSQKS